MQIAVSNDRRRFVWVLSILLVGGFLITSLVGYRVAHESLSSQITENALPLTSDNIYSEIQQDLLRPIFISSLMAQDTFLRDWVLDGEKDPSAIIRYLQEIQERYGTVTSFFVSEKTRKYYHPKGIVKTIGEDRPEDAWYFQARDLPSGQHYEINIDSDTTDRSATNVFVNYRVYDYGGRVIGIGGVGLAAQMVKQLIEIYQQRYGRRVYFIDRRGEIMLQGQDHQGPASIRQRAGIGKLTTRILTSPSGSYSFAAEGGTVYLNSRLIPEFDWYLMVEQEGDPSQQRLLTTLFINLLLSVLVTGLVLFLAHLTFSRYQSRLEQMATFDKLTGAMNRQVFETLFEKTLLNARRTQEPVSVIMLDLDHFKRVNDVHGHLVGDRVLRSISGILMGKIRDSDTACRWGGEEFLLLLPDCNLTEAAKLAESLRTTVEGYSAQLDAGSIVVTASFGVAQLQGEERQEGLIDRADQALYQAKNTGRNRVSCL